MSMKRYRLEHADGREWTKEELNEVVRVDREHDKMWPYDAECHHVAVDRFGCVFLLDNICAWHVPYPSIESDMVVVWND